MKNILITNLILLLSIVSYAQTNNTFKNFNEFIKDAPSRKYNFQIKQRSEGNVIMTGGVRNYRLRKVKPSTDADILNKYIWGIKDGDSLYINSYPYSKVFGFNKIIERGYYSYFKGEPARTRQEQLTLGLIEEGDKTMMVCCWTGYVILNDGQVKQLKPRLIEKLIQDNQTLHAEFVKKNLKIENVHEMFDYLSRYNQTK
ncbi:MAG: hypothetical protein OCD76_03525 [Reichenbachiella sp.]